MPIVAAVGLIGSAAAIAGGTLTVLETIAAVGTIVSSVGALTGNKAMMKIGAVAGLAGGIGAFASSQGWLASGSAAETATNAGSESSAIEAMKNAPSGAEFANPTDVRLAAGTQATPLAAEAGQLDMGATGGQTAGLANTNSIADTVSQASPELAKTAAAGSQPAGLMDATSPLADANPTDLRLAGGAQPSPTQPLGPDTSTMGAGAQPAGLANASDTQLTAGTKTAPAASIADQIAGTAKAGGTKIMDLFDKMFRDKDGKLDKNMLSLAGQFIGGAFDDEKKAKTDLYQAQADTLNAQRENANAVPNMNFKALPKPGGTFKPVAPTYQPVRLPGGLYNAR